MSDRSVTRRFALADAERMQQRIADLEQSERKLRDLCSRLRTALRYVRRFVKPEDVDTKYIDEALAAAAEAGIGVNV